MCLTICPIVVFHVIYIDTINIKEKQALNLCTATTGSCFVHPQPSITLLAEQISNNNL